MLALAPRRIRRPAAIGRVGRLSAALAVSLLVLALESPVLAQVFALAAPASANEKTESAFTLPTQTNEFRDALQEFQRMVEHEQWERAFESIGMLSEKTASGFIDRGDGVLVPSRLLVRSLLAKLPSSGRAAYRLFYDSQAVNLWDEAEGAAEADRLTAIVNKHLISSVGDRAADRLGDLYFERGNFEQAVVAWQMLVTDCPDSAIPKSQTLVKIATALARAGRWNEFRATADQIRAEHADELVEIAGRPGPAAAQLEQLAVATGDRPATRQETFAGDIELPADGESAWAFSFESKPNPQGQGNPFNLIDVYGRSRVNDFVIPAAADQERVYVNLFGVEMAFDLASGKMLWRSGKLHLLNLQQNRQGVSPERYTVDVYDGRVWSVARDPQQANQRGAFYLTVRDAATGRELFSSRRSLSSWSILGAPKVVGDVAYVGAQKAGQGRELALLILNAADGKLQKTIEIGSYAVDQNQLYFDTAPRPTFAWHHDRLYVDTHAGALVAVDPRSGGLDWAVLYECPPPSSGYYYNYLPPQFDVSGPLVVDGLVFCKGMRSPRLLGVTADGPTLVWNRPVLSSAVLVAADDACVYLGGEELTAYSLKTQELIWATQLPRAVDWSMPLVTDNRLYQFTSRGVCEVDKATGEILRIFRGNDLESMGGRMFVSPSVLVTVSNLGIRAYNLKGSADSAATSTTAVRQDRPDASE